MVKLLSNGHNKDFVRSAFHSLASRSKELLLAAPYFTYSEPIVDALRRGSRVSLLVGLNSATHPDALRDVLAEQRATVRFYTGRFHAKLYVFDTDALLGSANLTQAGFQSNREIVVWLSAPEDQIAINDSREIFRLLWDNARALSQGTLREFEYAWLACRQTGPDPDATIAAKVGKVEPPSVGAERQAAVGTQIVLENLRRQILEEYKPAFEHVSAILRGEGLYRTDVANIDVPFKTNRFLNWLRLTHATGDTWKNVPPRGLDEIRLAIVRWGKEWCAAKDGRVFKGYAEGIRGVLAPFADPAALASSSKDELTAGLLGIHAFTEQLRFTTGGKSALPARFWRENKDDVVRVRETLGYLLHGNGDLVERLHTATTDERHKIALFGKFCGLELCGTVKPAECPPVNGRSAKALCFLGYKVSAD